MLQHVAASDVHCTHHDLSDVRYKPSFTCTARSQD